MTSFIFAILQNTPIFVWGILGLLIALGIKQSRTQQLSLARIKLSLMLVTGLSVWGASSILLAHPIALLFWGKGLVIGLAFGRKLLARQPMQRLPNGLVQVPGSWIPLAVFLSIFLLRYVMKVTQIAAPELAATFAFSVFASLSYALPLGILLARALPLLRTRSSASANPSLTMVA